MLLRDIERGKDKQITALIQLNKAIQPDILLLSKVDFDLEQRTAQALKSTLGYRYAFTLAPNSMVPTTLDLDGDGRAGDRQTWVRYAGEGGMVLLSAYPVELMFHLNDLLWADVSAAAMPVDAEGLPFPSQAASNAQKLVSQGLWVVRVDPPQSDPITLVTFQNQTPVFDGPEDLNGLRNSAQLGLLSAVMDGDYGAFPTNKFVLIGNANLDPLRGAGHRSAIAKLLADERLQDAQPKSAKGGLATAIWENPGPMRVSYILPHVGFKIMQSAVVWPADGPLRESAEQASRHRMVWMDIKQSP